MDRNPCSPIVTLSLMVLALVASAPMSASASQVMGCSPAPGKAASFGGGTEGIEKALKEGLSKKGSSAEAWYAAGKSLADRGFPNLAFFSLDRSIRAAGSGSVAFLALDCIEKIQTRNSILDLPDYTKSLAALAKAAKSDSQKEILARFAFRSVVQNLSSVVKGGGKKTTKGSKSAGSRVLSAYSVALTGNGIYANAARGLIASAEGRWSAATSSLQSALNAIPEKPSAQGEFRVFAPVLRLELARSLYALGEDRAAIAEYEKLYRIGLPMQDALIESAWARLRAKDYAKALGLSFELSTGKLSEFFAPEALSIRSIAFVENCRYPEARSAIERFSSIYTPLAKWIRSSDSDGSPLYEKAIARAEGAIGNEDVPDKVWSIWTGSDLFISTQQAIQRAFTESREAGDWLAAEVSDSRVRAVLSDDLKKVTTARSRAALRIENHLEDLNASMLRRIDQEAERMRFVRIEANQGAGRDLVFRNANPESAKAEKKLIKQDRKEKSYKGKLAWGTVSEDDPSAETWIDEVGNFEAKSLDLCRIQQQQKKKKKN
jgi:tetratricopeptide (TPR) repeat protein